MTRLSNILEKISTSKEMAQKSGYHQTRKGRRPIRVDNLLKKAEGFDQTDQAGPVDSGPTPEVFKSSPTKGVAVAQKKLNQSTAEVGPMAGKHASKENTMLKHDPLICYLKKQAAEALGPTGLIDADGVLDTNEAKEDMPTREPVLKMKAEPVEATKEVRQSIGNARNYLKGIFENQGIRRKYTEKDHENREGVVDDTLGL